MVYHEKLKHDDIIIFRQGQIKVKVESEIEHLTLKHHHQIQNSEYQLWNIVISKSYLEIHLVQH